jgi:hypothetical protein
MVFLTCKWLFFDPIIHISWFSSLAKVAFTFILLVLHSHGEDDGYVFPEWFVTPRGGLGGDGRGGYGAVNENDD